MRKYHQAALAIISSVSLVALVLYRNEYIKLRHVLEVFDYFGRPNDYIGKNCTNLLNNAEYIIAASDSKIGQNFDEPITSWQRLNDDIYVYSAYAISDEEIRAVSFAKSKRLKSLSCKIVHENEIVPTIGEFSYKAIESSKNIDLGDEENSRKGIYRGYDLICRHKRAEKKNIAAVVFASRADRREYGNEISLSIGKLYPHNNVENDEIGICVASINSRYLMNDDIIDFISFHNSIGIERFIVYDTGLPQRLNNIMKHIGRQSGINFNLTYTTIPWNFPFSRVPVEVARDIVNADCLYRLYNKVRFVATLAWDEYIVMKYHRKIEKIFHDIDETGLTARRYGLSTIDYCHNRKPTNNNDDDDADDAKPMIVGDDTIVDDRSVYIYRSPSDASALDDDNAPKTRAITRDVIVINKYERPCNRSLELKSVDDPYVGKFSRVVRTSPIYKLFRLYI